MKFGKVDENTILSTYRDRISIIILFDWKCHWHKHNTVGCRCHYRALNLTPATVEDRNMFQGGFCKILPSCQRNVTVVFDTLLLNELGFGYKWRHRHIYWRLFATVHKVNFCKSGKRIFPMQRWLAMKHARNVDKCNIFECHSPQMSIS